MNKKVHTTPLQERQNKMIFLDMLPFIYERAEGYDFFNMVIETLPVEQGGDGADEPYNWIFGDITMYEYMLRGVKNAPTTSELMEADWFDGVHAMVFAAIDRNLPDQFSIDPNNGWLAFYNPTDVPVTYDEMNALLHSAIWVSVNIDKVLEQGAEFVKYQARNGKVSN